MRRLITILVALALFSTNAWALSKPTATVRDYDMTAEGVDGTGSKGYSVVFLDNYDGGAVSGCVGELCGSHPAADIRCDHIVVYSIAPGTVFKVVGNVDDNDINTRGWGNYIMIKHTPSDIDGINENVYSVYAHLSSIGYDLSGDGGLLQAGDRVFELQSIAVSGQSGTWTLDEQTGQYYPQPHLHFQIDREKRLDNGAVIHSDTQTPEQRKPFWRGDWSTINIADIWHTNDNSVINPMPFVQMNEYKPCYIPVGFILNEDYSGRPHWALGANGQPDSGISQKFRDRYDRVFDERGTSLGFPWTNPAENPDFSSSWISYPQAVHQINESMWIQDFYGPHNGYYNPHSSLIMKYGGNVVLLKEGFWDLWMNHVGWLNFGPPVTEEVPVGSGVEQRCELNGVPFYMRWVPGDQARIYDQYNGAVNLNNLRFMPGGQFKMILDDGSKSVYPSFQDFPEMVVDADNRSGGGSRSEPFDTPAMKMSDGLKSLQSDGVYHSEIRLAGFGEDISLVNGRTYDSFYIINNGQEFQVEPFTVSGDGTIEVNTSNPNPQVQFGYWTIYPDPGDIGQQIHVEGQIYNNGSTPISISEARVEFLDPNGNEVYHWSEYNVSIQPGYGWYQYLYCYPYMAGNHTARFKILIGSEWTVLSTRTVYVEGNQLTAQFSANVRLGDVPLSVQFTNLSSGNPTSWSWDFGDGNLSTAQNPSHTYNVAGTYAVRLDVYDSYSSDFEVKYNYITVNDALNAYFTSAVTAGLAPLQVQFTDQSSGSPTSWLWNFGDGTTSNTQNPNHLYSAAGIYNVSLTVSDQSGSDTMTKSGYVVVGGLHADFSANDTSIGAGELVRFTDLSTGDPTSWTWNFGDGSVFNHVGAMNHTYMNPGVYTVTLTVANNMGSDVETKTNYITVGESVLSFTADVVSGRVPLTVNFAGSAPGNPTQWCWDFGDGTITGLGDLPCTQYITHVYEEAGTYDVGLAVADGNGMSVYVIYEDFITVDASFTANVREGVKPLTVNFTDESGFSASTWSWNFGDGVTSTTHNPTHVYSTAGFYTVTFVAGTGPSALTVVRENYIHVADSNMGFEADVTYGAPPLTVHFTNLSLGNPIFWGWDFGDGGISMDRNPAHTYNTVGTYSVMLLAFYGTRTDTLIYDDYINVVNQVLNANFTSDVTSGIVPLQVQFTDQSLGSPTSWLWNFGDGTTSTVQSPGHTYESGGIYTVSLVVSSGAAIDSLSRQDFITVNSAIDARFTSNVTQGIVPLQVQFTDQSLGSPTSWLWNFGDGTTSTEQSPTHTYNVLGSYDVSLTISSEAGSSYINHTDYVLVINGLYAQLTTSTSYGVAPLTVHFYDQSLGGPTSWLWNFGDGTTSTEQNPTHTYNTVGTYDLSLMVVAGSDSSTTVIEGCAVALGELGAYFAADDTLGATPFTVQFTNQSSGSPTSWLWNFGDGTTSTEQSPTHTYNTVGTYDVSLLVARESRANALVVTGMIRAVEPVVADFIGNPTSVYTRNPVQFTDQSTGNPTSWAWNFGDGSSSTEQSPTHAYAIHGTYTVSLTVSDGVSGDTLVRTDYIHSSKPAPPEDPRYPYCEPNPSNPVSVIKFKMNRSGHVNLNIYDIKGRRVMTLMDQILDVGVHQVTFDGSNLASGTYFYMISSAEGNDIGKVMVVK